MNPIPYFDAHCDTIYRCLRTGAQLRENDGHLDLRRASAFGRFAQVFALYQDPEEVPQGSTMVREGQLLHQKFLREMEQNRNVIVPCRTGAEVDRAAADGKMAAILSIEGAELIGCDPGQVETAAEWGVRLLNPVWNHANRLSGSNAELPEQGLTSYGRDFARRMEDCGIYPDVSHISDPGFWDVVRLARGPVVASHSNSRALCPHRRNLTDDMFRAIRDSGGVVGLNLYRPFVGPAGTMEELTAHVEHFLSLGGEKTLCLGGDLDGCEELAAGMEGIQDVPQLWQALAARGYPQTLLEDLFWNNLRRLI
jgi:membrane dipeptidase